jgi:hypothetical protein
MLGFAALLLASTALEPSLAAAPFATSLPQDDKPGFSYTYVEGNYTWLDSDAAHDTLNGLELTGSLELPLNFFVQLTSSTLNGDADLDELRLGAGWHFSLGDTLDAYGLLSYVDQKFDSGVSDEDGITGDAGVRLMLTPKIEVGGYGEWANIDDSEVGLGATARYYLTSRLSLGTRVLLIDSGNLWAAGLRFQF